MTKSKKAKTAQDKRRRRIAELADKRREGRVRRIRAAAYASDRAEAILAVVDATNNIVESDPVLYEIERNRRVIYHSNRTARRTLEENAARLAQLSELAGARRKKLGRK